MNSLIIDEADEFDYGAFEVMHSNRIGKTIRQCMEIAPGTKRYRNTQRPPLLVTGTCKSAFSREAYLRLMQATSKKPAMMASADDGVTWRPVIYPDAHLSDYRPKLAKFETSALLKAALG